jgi:neutral ceramidase
LSAANGVTRFAVNRRTNKESEIRTTYDLNGPVDHSVPVLKVAREDGSLVAVLFGYACHNTVLMSYQWCGDYAGFAQIELEQAYPGATALFFAGCEADQNPLPRRTEPLALKYGRELANTVQEVLSDPMKTLDPVLKTEYAEADLTLMPAPSRAEIEAMIPSKPNYLQIALKDFLRDLDAGKKLRTNYPFPVQVWRLGNQNLVALGGEAVVEYAILVKQILGPETFVAAYSNDVCSYIPSLRVLREGGYEGAESQAEYGMPNKWQEDIEARILGTVRTLGQQAGATITGTELPSTAPKSAP